MSTYADPPSHSAGAPSGPLTPPHDLQAEESVLGAVMLSDRALYGLVIEDGLKADDFYRERHRIVFAAMLALYQESEPVDVLTVTSALRQSGKLDEVGGQVAIASLAASVPSAAHARHYAGIVKEHALTRRLLDATYVIQARVLGHEGTPRELVEDAERAMMEVAHDDSQKEFRSVDEILEVELEKLEKLSRDKTALTGTPSGFKDLDDLTGGFQPGNLIILAARPSMGKCLTGDTLIHDPSTGERVRLDRLVERIESGDECWVTSLGPDLRLRRSLATAAFRNGERDVFKVTTRLGRTLTATANHPLLTIGGWRQVGELGPGARVAVPRRLPRTEISSTMTDAELVMLATLIADGNTTQTTPRVTWGSGSEISPEVSVAARDLGATLSIPRGGHGTGTVSTPRGRPNPVTELCKRHGIWGCRGDVKRVPDAVFRLSDAQLGRFLGVLYGCDGHIYASERLTQIGYTSISRGLVEDLQHLLLRLGIVAVIRRLRREVYEGTEKTAWELRITGQEGCGQFLRLVRVVGKTKASARAASRATTTRPKTNVDTLPIEVWPLVSAARGARSWAELSRAAGYGPGHSWHVGERGLSRDRAAQLASLAGSEELGALAASDLWWDEIATIEPAGRAETFDITVPGDHNFVADDLVVHNSALVTNIAENSSLDHGRPVALFSLEMSEAELAQRFLASQARVKGENLRKGQAERSWHKIMAAAERLADAPLYVDDSSDIGILEVRAKARRLHQKEQSRGGLGLIIVDYLQLLRPDGRTDNRVEQVGQMSRGLKILARELEVPVIALSQLSRGVESRTDKRPVLSDLRESGQIEQDADLVMFIYRDEYYDRESERIGEADVIIAKHRNGALGDVTLTFQKDYPKFMNYLNPDRAG